MRPQKLSRAGLHRRLVGRARGENAKSFAFLVHLTAWKSLRAGMTQDDFGRLVSQAHSKLGFSGSAGVQVWDVRVTNPDASTAVLEDAFTVSPPP